ncbi:uncharacterized protein, partial [Littorina saxatilis]|uniref:uncharacterized protein n=1 Tax=Littorina saxatilis TaxID=31220 RepID=UPI0038B5438B
MTNAAIVTAYLVRIDEQRSLPAGELSSNYRAELTALREAVSLVSEHPPSHPVFLTDCRSAVQSLQSPKEQLERDTHRLLCTLSQSTNVAVQWIPAHCGLSGNEEADRLAKTGSHLEQTRPTVSYKKQIDRKTDTGIPEGIDRSKV